MKLTASTSLLRPLHATHITAPWRPPPMWRRHFGMDWRPASRFGWVAEQVAVIPRRTVSSRCGNGKTGLVKWYARLDQAFGVFCFSATAAPQISTSVSATSTTLFTTTPVIPPHPSSTAISSSSPATTTKVPLSWISHLAHISTSSTPLPYHASYSPSSAHPLPSHVITSSLSSSTSAQTYASNQQMPTKPPQKAFWAVLIILGVAFLMVTVTGVLCYYYRLRMEKSFNCSCKAQPSPTGCFSVSVSQLCNTMAGGGETPELFSPHRRKRNRWKNEPFRSRALQGDDVEAEMWKPTNSRTAINHPLNEDHEEEEEEEERDAKYSSDIMLCVNPQLRSGNNTIS
ncbi:lymphatic vessel endothelial hyaluronic receptor 1b isoform X2 [Corythoichthys intestinalis]|uniref:lymphatic vessel endothelial hyaluronic receptor 1b isoform X2 n=1 Tax=Corythoichthys intestinalis TaxID=161448 RepID=UPI0025A5AC05|nr:lymphatic vessel endothelial hyaluronic receptor 1b isoform X2 [Corythoichthys intestinalis]